MLIRVTRRKLTVLNFFPAFYPPKSGGELRYYHIYKNLGDYYDITMINPTHPFVEPELVDLSENVKEHRIPKCSTHIKLHQIFGKYGRFPECSAVVVAIASLFQQTFRDTFKSYAKTSEIIVREFPFLVNIPKKKRGHLWVYNAYNIEYDLHKVMLRGWLGKFLSLYIWYLERTTCRLSDLIFTTSEFDRRRFIELYGVSPNKIFVEPNGVDTSELKFVSKEEKNEIKTNLGYHNNDCFLFIGSFHPPNMEAVEFIMKSLAQELKDSLFIIAGKVCDYFKEKPVPDNVVLLGLVSEEKKRLLLAGCDLALNPMFSGSGTNLKMLDYMAVGLPIVTTSIGARGLEITDREHVIISENKCYAENIRELQSNSSLYEKLRFNSRNLVEKKYDWKNIAADIYERIEEIF